MRDPVFYHSIILPFLYTQFSACILFDSHNNKMTLEVLCFYTLQVLVMTAQILLNILRHSIIKMEAINLLILDECHHAVKKHPYSLVMSEFYHTTPKEKRPSVFGMTASPVNLKGMCFFFLLFSLLGWAVGKLHNKCVLIVSAFPLSGLWNIMWIRFHLLKYNLK